MNPSTLAAKRPYTVVATGRGPRYWVAGDHLTFKLGPAETDGRFTLAETTVPPGGGPPPHVHHREDEMFYVLEGSFAFLFGEYSYRGSAGDMFYLPKGIVHTFKNVGTTPARLLVIATPSGFESFIPEAGCVCNGASETAPGLDEAAVAKLLAACGKYGLEMRFDAKPGPVAPHPHPGRELWVFGSHVNLKLTAKETAGHYCAAEVTCAPGDAVPPHAHTDVDEVFFIVDGAFEFTLNGDTVSAPAGTCIHVPIGVVHGFRNAGAVPAKLVDYHTPAGFEAFFQECGIPCTDRANPPVTPPPPSPDQIAALFHKYGMTLP